jgi:hypothetical protein
MPKFEREERYIVLKRSQLTDHQIHEIESMHLPTVESVVVESDWPNYEKTWADIEAVIDCTFSN